MAKYSKNKISSKLDDWGHDITNGLPYSGASVQEWIKEQLDGRAGYFHYDATNNRFLVFADEANKDLYEEDPIENATLLIGTFDAPFNYTANINLINTNTVNYIKYGSIGNYIKAEFDVLNKSGASIGENVNVTITFRNGSATSKITRSIAYGSQLYLNVDDYLLVGTNVITISAVGQNTLAATSIGITYYCVNLVLTDSFDISQKISNTGNLNIAFNITGGGIKRLQWYIDGTQVPYDSQNDDVTSSEASRIKTIPLSSYNLTNGRHNLQYRAYVETGDGSLFYSDTLYRDFIVDNGYLQDYLTVVAFDFPYDSNIGNNGIIDPSTTPLPIYGASQYLSKDIFYAVNSPFGESTMYINLDNVITTSSVSNGNVYTYRLQSFSSGVKYLTFTLGNSVLEANAHFSPTQYSDLEEVTNGLIFEFNKNDSTNSSSNKDSWSYGNYSATMNGFSWTNRSGWTNDGLLMTEGTSFVTNFAPLSGDVVNNGLTFEIEFETLRVLDDSTIICDLRNDGTGLLLTASEASLTSRGGTKVSTKYKSGVPIRVSFVVNSPSAIRNKNLLFIYIDGILAGAINYATSDSFTSNAFLQFIGSENASILLKQIKCYNRALSAEEILNNYILYRPTTDELVEVYDRNNILDDNNQPSYEKLSAYTPIIIVTGDVEKLMNFDRSNKGTYVKMDKIEIINNLDPTKNLTIVNASMRCQGTSSMDYPRKNFRFYLKKDSADTTVENYVTKVYDYQGVELKGGDRKYSFKDGAQPVSCWCLKADYAESSSTHNTGVARLWNTVMKNAVIQDVDSRHYILDEYPNSKTPCRTLAQHAALENGFDKDVRTTVDGFPIVLFYHRYESDALICLGKYNWNNDKSTESVYGFCDIPGFDDSNMECWEVVNGDYAINQFIDITNWSSGKNNGGWQDSFEARYPDDSGEQSEADRAEGALKTICTWINSTNGASTISNGKVVVGNSTLMNKFKSEKWDHLDVYKIAAYYIYLMRFGGVDQTVKNAMFTTEDGLHWYYINYDNDTILGVRNDGLLKFGYDIDRQSKDPDNANAYCYAGHDSVLWNNLEADSEFMNLVKVVDQALFNAGLTYTNVINMFNNEQSGKWSERLHNYDYTYKYLDVWLDDQNMQLEKLQGPRRTHREWWLSNRFALYDAKNNTGQYLKSYVSIKPSTDGATSSGDIVYVTPKVDNQVFGWRLGTNGAIHSANGESGTAIPFDLYQAGISYYIGGSLFFFNAVYMEKIDFSNIASHIQELSFGDVNSDVFPSYLEEVIVNKPTSAVNTAMSNIGNLGNVKYLRKLQMCNCTSVSTIDLSSNIYLEEFDARGSSSLSSVSFPDGAPVTSIQLPSSIQSLYIKDLVNLNTLSIEGNGPNLKEIHVVNCKPFNDNINWLKTWMTGKTDEYLAQCTIYVDGIYWSNVNVNDLLAFRKIGNVTFKGTIQANITSPETEILALQQTYGTHCFESTNDLWITSSIVYHSLVGPNTIVEGEIAQYALVVSGVSGTIQYRLLDNNRSGVILNSITGQLATTLNNEEDSTLVVQALFTPTDPTSQNYFVEQMNVTILKETYPSNSDITISGDDVLYDSQNRNYSATVANSESYTGMQHVSHSWSITGDLADYYYIASQPANELTCVLACYNNTYAIVAGTIRLTFTNSLGTIVAYKDFEISAQSGNVAVSRYTNPEVMTAFWNAYGTNGSKLNGEEPKIANADYITKFEASAFISSDLGDGTTAGSIFYQSGIKSFSEIINFIGLKNIPANLFNGISTLRGDIVLPDSIAQGTETTDGEVQMSAFSGTNISSLSGKNVYKVVSPDTAWGFNISFPECISYSGGCFKNNAVIYLPKCASFSYGTDSSSEFTITLGTLNVSKTTGGFTARHVNLIVSKYCAIPTGNVFIPFTSYTGSLSSNPLKSITLEDGVTLFGVENGCLYNVDTGQLIRAHADVEGSVILSTNIKSIRYRAFYGCTKMTSIDASNLTGDTGYQAFRNCIALESVVLGGTSVGHMLFDGCSNLSYVHILSTVTTFNLNSNATQSPFSYDNSRKSPLLTVGPYGGGYNVEYDWTASIPANAFRETSSGGSPSFRSITLSSTITSLGNTAIAHNKDLRELISYAASAPTLGTNNFVNSGSAYSGDKTLYVHTNATGYESGRWADPLCASLGFVLSKTL